jgi:AmmeMemoRadiSam system protein A
MDPGEYSREERVWLLRVAHDSILTAFHQKKFVIEPLTEHLAEPRGAFTSLHLRGQLRGCVGYVFPVTPLYRTVAETARSAAFDDSRFEPISAAEGPLLEIEISVLSLLQPIVPEEVEIGRHGLLITKGNRRGLLLPQVPVEHEWDRSTFLEQVCHKAGLAANSWQHGAKLECFTAEVFSDRDYLNG